MSEELNQEWDKVFPKSEKVEHKKVSFKNHFARKIIVTTQSSKTSAPLIS